MKKTKTEIVALFKDHLAQTDFYNNHPNDNPALCQAWVDFLDSLQRSGEITEKQRINTTPPAFVQKAYTKNSGK